MQDFKLSHPCFVYINNRCGYQSITQQYLKKCSIQDEVNYMFRPNVAIIKVYIRKYGGICFTGLVWICHDGEISASVMFVICYL